jgi:hypothetical protein
MNGLKEIMWNLTIKWGKGYINALREALEED